MNDIFSKRLASVKWDKMSVSLNKPVIYNKAEEACIGYIYNSEAFVTYAPLEQYEVLSDPVSLGKALDIAVCYDARWRQTFEGTFNYFTFGDPWIFIVDMANRLFMQRGVTGARTLIATGVTRVSACRGWKHITDYSIDQGLCVYYVKGTTGYVRSYIETAPDKFGLTSEEALPQLGSIKEIVAKRTNDYRIMIVGSSDVNDDVLAVTERTWPGMSVKPETIKPIALEGANFITGQIKTVEDTRHTFEEHTVGQINASFDKEIRETVNLNVYNISYCGNVDHTVYIYFSDVITCTDWVNLKRKIKIADSANLTVPIRSCELEGYSVKLECLGLEYTNGDMHLSIEDNTFLSNASGFIGAKNYKFKLVGIDKVVPEPPQVVTVYNTDKEVL